jgi:putative endonuclease
MQAQTFDDDKTTIEIGATSEDRAVAHLVRIGMRIVERNYRCKLGELDVIARDAATLVFVEVRSRRSPEHGNALDAISWHKRRRVSRMAMAYLAARKPRFDEARFDVIAITGNELVHIKDAWRL